MTIVAVVIAGLAIGGLAAAYRRRQTARRWRAERQRIERYGEHLAASNGRPDGDIVAVVPQSRDPQPRP